MGMVIQHNILALNISYQNKITYNKKSKTIERLSSGYRINRAADDAAGLAISEKMRSQIRGLNQGMNNIQNGISLCQVADGALEETTEILKRINELSVQAANGTNTKSDRQNIQHEVDELIKEVDRIAYNTSFNKDIFPLLGESDNINSSVVNNGWMLPNFVSTKSFSIRLQNAVTWDGVLYSSGNVLTGTCIEIRRNEKDTDHDNYIFGNYNSLTWIGTLSQSDFEPLLNSSFGNRPTGWYNMSIDDLNIDEDGYIYYHWRGDPTAKIYPMVYDDAIGGSWSGNNTHYPDPEKTLRAVKNNGNSQNGKNSNVWIQMGANYNEGMYINLVNATTEKLGISNINVTTVTDAENAIKTTYNAINTVNKCRSIFGSQQNRLEHGLLVNQNQAENTSAAESRIRDTDMAKEILRLSIENILEQTGQSMLTQANQNNGKVLDLLKNL